MPLESAITSMKFQCPECDLAIEVDARFIGKRANCPHCDREIKVPAAPSGPPEVDVTLAPEPGPEPPSWRRLPWRKSASVANALRIGILGTGILIVILLVRIDYRLSTLPTLGDRYKESGENPPTGTRKVDLRAPLIAPAGGIEVSNTVDVKVENMADDPVPVKIRD